ncbi:MmcQ/YjbR family DNA-binding protein [Tersicoccus sp. MR15.9]|uniref:MmcQ/YjbR family DNA-binding protein n=1 Tax=Tersicoccus mangrovi TaxID=3121635 RepID=UPI002FE656FF
MAHPRMFDEDDPYLAHVRRLSLALPGASELISHGRPVFRTVKVFALYGGSTKADAQTGIITRYQQSVLVHPGPSEQAYLLAQPSSYAPAYMAASGWVGIDLTHRDGADGVDWIEIAELIDASWRATAPPILTRGPRH